MKTRTYYTLEVRKRDGNGNLWLLWTRLSWLMRDNLPDIRAYASVRRKQMRWKTRIVKVTEEIVR
jgi:hypothetical protein